MRDKEFDGLSGIHAGHKWVDLGIRINRKKILFATCNVGADKPEDFGDYFAWGETTKRYTSINGNKIVGGTFKQDNAPFYSNEDYTKYNQTDGLTTLEAEDDVANVQWGDGWRMPDVDELEALLLNTVTYEWTNNYNSTGKAGLIITGKGDYSENSIFLPAAGYCIDSNHNDAGYEGNYWSRSLNAEYTDETFKFACYEEANEVSAFNRYNGYSIRPVLAVKE